MRGDVARIIIADDHDLARAGVRSLLSGERGLAIVGEAATGRGALELCRQLQPDLALVDVRMPDLDGLSVTREIKRESPSTSVILLTIYQNAEYVVQALTAGAAGYLLKGAAREDIVSTVRKVLAGEFVLHSGEVLALLRQLTKDPAETGNHTTLTERERDVLRLMVLGRTNPQIAQTLHLTRSTVKTHVEHVIGKLAVSDRTQAAVRAIQLGLVTAEDVDREPPGP
jgi:DNA-binding NarL/FixJ family response regulator